MKKNNKFEIKQIYEEHYFGAVEVEKFKHLIFIARSHHQKTLLRTTQDLFH